DEGAAVVIVERRVEEALELRPNRVLYLEDGATRYLGPLEGFLEVADPTAVKLPFEVILEQVRGRGPGAVQTDSNAAGAPATRPSAAAAPEGETPRLEMHGVHAGYPGNEVLHGVEVSLGPREVVAILGPNGSGKTTLFRAAMKLLPIGAGSVLVNGSSNEAR